jgi:hypothetical protein
MRLVGARRRSEWRASEGLGGKSQGTLEKRAAENAVPLETAARDSDGVDRLLACRRDRDAAGTETQDVRKTPVDTRKRCQRCIFECEFGSVVFSRCSRQEDQGICTVCD